MALDDLKTKQNSEPKACSDEIFEIIAPTIIKTILTWTKKENDPHNLYLTEIKDREKKITNLIKAHPKPITELLREDDFFKELTTRASIDIRINVCLLLSNDESLYERYKTLLTNLLEENVFENNKNRLSTLLTALKVEDFLKIMKTITKKNYRQTILSSYLTYSFRCGNY